MQASERLRERMVAAGVELPAALVDVIVMAAGPFSPAQRLTDDAAG